MGVILQSGYTVPSGDQPLTHARIAHASNWHAGTVTASTTAAGYFADGPDESTTYEKWQPTTLAATWELDFGGNKPVDYCCIAAHDMGTRGNSLQVQRYNLGSWDDMIPTTAISDDMPLFCIFDKTTDTRFRVRISGGSAPSIGVIRFGAAMQMERALYGGHAPADLERETSTQANISESGEFLGRTVTRTALSVRMNWENVTASWVRSNWRAFQKAIESEPFFIAWRPETFSEVAYAQAIGPATAVNAGVRDLMKLGLSARGYGYD